MKSGVFLYMTINPAVDAKFVLIQNLHFYTILYNFKFNKHA